MQRICVLIGFFCVISSVFTEDRLLMFDNDDFILPSFPVMETCKITSFKIPTLQESRLLAKLTSKDLKLSSIN
ncbi:hypothetical protein L596_026384 [Steinernema carpocapsae]|uniref:Uncharacterized protein n=1 Tax=Steinernema carpocapsae TaxID=34508 RepID=A0A4U5M172_STECR|nr:hypothetical protein L596_026384 [Steinernema carpocapsae]